MFTYSDSIFDYFIRGDESHAVIMYLKGIQGLDSAVEGPDESGTMIIYPDLFESQPSGKNFAFLLQRFRIFDLTLVLDFRLGIF